jgi:putative transposase
MRPGSPTGPVLAAWGITTDGKPASIGLAPGNPPGENSLAKVPAGMQAEVKDAYWQIFDTEDLKTPPGRKLTELIDARISEMAARYSAAYPSAMKCLTTDQAGLTSATLLVVGHREGRCLPSRHQTGCHAGLGAASGAACILREIVNAILIISATLTE